MQRASGVYKENSRGVAILLVTAIAVANADTINIINRLSKDAMLELLICTAVGAKKRSS